MAGRKSDFTLPKFDDIFSTQEMRDDEKLVKIRDIPLELIDDFPDHPYKVRDDEDMMQLVESIKERGVITPATVRQKEDGRYELISGHRRKRASELAGFETLRCEVVELDRDDATILMVESNLQRSVILPSEKAFAYKMRLDAMKRKAGRPSKENVSPVGTNLRTDEIIAQETGDILLPPFVSKVTVTSFSFVTVTSSSAAVKYPPDIAIPRTVGSSPVVIILSCFTHFPLLDISDASVR